MMDRMWWPLCAGVRADVRPQQSEFVSTKLCQGMFVVSMTTMSWQFVTKNKETGEGKVWVWPCFCQAFRPTRSERWWHRRLHEKLRDFQLAAFLSSGTKPGGGLREDAGCSQSLWAATCSVLIKNNWTKIAQTKMLRGHEPSAERKICASSQVGLFVFNCLCVTIGPLWLSRNVLLKRLYFNFIDAYLIWMSQSAEGSHHLQLY